MFKKLRIQFLLIIMTIITAVMAVSFFTVYIITYRNIFFENKERLNSIFELYNQPSFYFEESIVIDISINTANFDTYIFVKLDENNHINQINSTAPFDLEFYENLVNHLLENGTSGEIVEIYTRLWLLYIDTTSNGSIFALLDITERTVILHNLLITFIIIGISMLVAIFFISLLFARYTVKPIENSWIKQQQFIADASHELKTPIAIIVANISAIKVKPNELHKFINYIEIQTKRLTELITHLLTLSSYDQLLIKKNYDPINFSQLVNTVVISMEVLAYEKNIRIVSSIESDIYVRSDKGKMNQILVILFDNAIKHSAADNKTIYVNLLVDGKFATFEIINAIDYPKQINTEKLFDRFYRTDEARVHQGGGYGLGLSIAKAITTELGGNITVQLDKNRIIFSLSVNKISF